MDPKEMLEAINTCIRLDDEFRLSEWEENFIIDMEKLVEKGVALSPQRRARLESIYDRT